MTVLSDLSKRGKVSLMEGFTQVISRVCPAKADNDKSYTSQWWPKEETSMQYVKMDPMYKSTGYVIHARHSKQQVHQPTLRQIYGLNFEYVCGFAESAFGCSLNTKLPVKEE